MSSSNMWVNTALEDDPIEPLVSTGRLVSERAQGPGRVVEVAPNVQVLEGRVRQVRRDVVSAPLDTGQADVDADIGTLGPTSLPVGSRPFRPRIDFETCCPRSIGLYDRRRPCDLRRGLPGLLPASRQTAPVPRECGKPSNSNDSLASRSAEFIASHRIPTRCSSVGRVRAYADDLAATGFIDLPATAAARRQLQDCSGRYMERSGFQRHAAGGGAP